MIENGTSSVFHGLEQRLFDMNKRSTPQGEKHKSTIVAVPKRRGDDYGSPNYLPPITEERIVNRNEKRVILEKKNSNKEPISNEDLTAMQKLYDLHCGPLTGYWTFRRRSFRR